MKNVSLLGALAGVFIVTLTGSASAQTSLAQAPMTPRELYVAACANCHGDDGRGAAKSQVGFADPLPDFSDCSYASRENAQDWFAVVHQGGPVRVFSQRMPSFGAALSKEQIERVVAYVRSLCTDRSWPRGELNFPRAMATEKAFPEDETVVTVNSVGEAGTRRTETTLIYEKRFGSQNQVEVAVPVVTQRALRLGDIAFAYKRALLHDGERGHILSAGAEVIVPTGDRKSGAGGGVTVLEPFLLAGHALPANSFVQMHAGYETSLGHAPSERAVFLRTAVGTTVTAGFGRAFSPIAEFIADREFTTGAKTQWDWIPQMQVSVSRRQHILASVGVRMPVTERKSRPREFVAYLIWDWFDGPFFSGW